MSYLVLARKWRPQGFDDIIGQEPIVRILKNSIMQGKTAHAYVFSGPRGVGKTSTARILAKGLNCATGPTPEPCGKCDSCTSITEGSSVDVFEIDGASNNSVDDIRDLRERVKYAPSGGKHKVYIIDEAHMLSTSAFNALLKTLEEPPPHVVFMLATTESRKIPLTVMSRCQHLPFRRISLNSIRERLSHISSSEGIEITDQALGILARAADGSIRDSLTILDQVVSFSDNIGESDIKNLLDISDFESLSSMAEAIIEGDREVILRITEDLVDRGTDLRAYTKDLIKFFRDMLVTKILSSHEQMVDIGAEELEKMKTLADKASDEYLILILAEVIRAEADVKTSFSPRVAFEMSIIKLSLLDTFKDVDRAISSLTNTESAAKQEEYEEIIAPVSSQTTQKRPLEGIPDVNALLSEISNKIDDPRVASFLEKAAADLKDNTLTLTFSSAGAELCSKPFKDNPGIIEDIASGILGAPVKLQIHVRQSRREGKKELKEKVMSEPAIKEALDLFEGRVVDVKKQNNNET
jgi:DNA polymerase-3 subunit gamma/tau